MNVIDENALLGKTGPVGNKNTSQLYMFVGILRNCQWVLFREIQLVLLHLANFSVEPVITARAGEVQARDR